MSRPLAWNGTAWKDPSFWTGSAWKTYIPPVYDVPVGQWTFDSGGEGWLNYDVAQGGYIAATTPGGWYGNVVNMAGPDVTNRPLKPGVLIRCRFLWQTAPVVTGYADNRKLRLAFYYQDYDIPLPSPTNGPTWTTHPYTIMSDAINDNYYATLNARAELWGTNDDQVTLYLHECRMEDAYTGEPLLALGDPGWEPFVWDGGKWT